MENDKIFKTGTGTIGYLLIYAKINILHTINENYFKICQQNYKSCRGRHKRNLCDFGLGKDFLGQNESMNEKK